MERTVTLRRLVISVVINIFCLRQTQTWKLEIVPIISLKAFSNISPVKYTVNTVILYYLLAILNTTITFNQFVVNNENMFKPLLFVSRERWRVFRNLLLYYDIFSKRKIITRIHLNVCYAYNSTYLFELLVKQTIISKLYFL